MTYPTVLPTQRRSSLGRLAIIGAPWRGQYSAPNGTLVARIEVVIEVTSQTESVTFYSLKSCNPTSKLYDTKAKITPSSGYGLSLSLSLSRDQLVIRSVTYVLEFQ